MTTNLPLSVTLAVRMVVPEWPPQCERCAEDMEDHQPDPGLPERLLLCCPSCRAWVLQVRTPDGWHASELTLPDGAALIDAAFGAMSEREPDQPRWSR